MRKPKFSLYRNEDVDQLLSNRATVFVLVTEIVGRLERPDNMHQVKNTEQVWKKQYSNFSKEYTPASTTGTPRPILRIRTRMYDA